MNCGIDLAQSLLAYKNGQRGYEPMRFNQRLYTQTSEAYKLPYFTTETFLPCGLGMRDENQLASCDYDRNKVKDSICTITRTLTWEEDGETVTEDVTTPILYAPLPRHKFENSGALVKFSAGFHGLSDRPANSNIDCYLYLCMYRITPSKYVGAYDNLPETGGEEGVFYIAIAEGDGLKHRYMYEIPAGSETETKEWVDRGVYDAEVVYFDPNDPETYTTVHRAIASYLITGKSSYNATYTSPSPVSSAAPGSRKRVSLHAEGYFDVPTDRAQYIIAPRFLSSSSCGVRCEQAYLNVELYHEKI